MCPIFRGQAVQEEWTLLTAWPLNMGLIGCPKKMVTSYQPMPGNIPE